MIKVECGANSVSVAVGQTVGEIRRAQGDALHIAANAKAFVDGREVKDRYRPTDGQILGFVVPAGRKG
ncbi:MAG: hypothetical protein NTZ65_03220 [Candidatus Berkelbacteria bacterium]|nr:hypothetical protein [Candidatus Berkelbacteria bacterium]